MNATKTQIRYTKSIENSSIVFFIKLIKFYTRFSRGLKAEVEKQARIFFIRRIKWREKKKKTIEKKHRLFPKTRREREKKNKKLGSILVCRKMTTTKTVCNSYCDGDVIKLLWNRIKTLRLFRYEWMMKGNKCSSILINTSVYILICICFFLHISNMVFRKDVVKSLFKNYFDLLISNRKCSLFVEQNKQNKLFISSEWEAEYRNSLNPLHFSPSVWIETNRLKIISNRNNLLSNREIRSMLWSARERQQMMLEFKLIILL